MNKALFLDRDGVVNVERDFVFKIDQFVFNKGIFDVCLKFQNSGFLIFIITNQSGIARGYYSLNEFQLLTGWMINMFRIHGVKIQKVYFCPHHPAHGGECECRKPKPGMIIEACNEFNIDLSQSVLIGDKISDIQSGEKAGIRTNIMVKNGFFDEIIFG